MSDVTRLERQLEKLVAEGAASSRILGTAERLLVLRPAHAAALRHKAVCCIHADKFGAALATLEQLATSTQTSSSTRGGKTTTTTAAPTMTEAHDVAFLRAYCLYRLHQYAEAKAALQGGAAAAAATTTSGGVVHAPSRHLLAQIHYNLEEYAQAAALYEAMMRDTHDADELHELTVNRTAALVACEAQTALRCAAAADCATASEAAMSRTPQQDVAVDAAIAAGDSYDVVYNAAAALIELHEYARALRTLRRAEWLCAQEHPTSRIRSLADVCVPVARARAREDGDDKSDGRRVAGDDDDDEAAAAAAATRVRWFAAPPPGHSAAAAAVTAERRFFADVANTWVQMAFVYDALGHDDVARAIVQLVLHAKPTSSVTSALASINDAALQLRARGASAATPSPRTTQQQQRQAHADVFDAQHRLRSAHAAKATRRLTSRQGLVLLYNTALLYLECGNVVRCRQALEQLTREHAMHPLTHSLQLALALRERRKKRQGKNSSAPVNANGGDATATSEDDDTLVRELQKRYEGSLEQVATAALLSSTSSSTRVAAGGGTLSTLPPPTMTDVTTRRGTRVATTAQRCVQAQLALEQGDVRGAVTALAALPHDRTTAGADMLCWPATLATLTAWRMQVGDEAAALQALTDAVTHARDDDGGKRHGGGGDGGSSAGGCCLSTRAAKSLLVWAVHYLTTLASTTTTTTSSSSSNNSASGGGRALYSECAELLRRARAAVPALRTDRDVAALLVLCLAHVDVAAAREVAAQDLREYYPYTPASASSQQQQQQQQHDDAAAAAAQSAPTRAQVEQAGFRRPTALDASQQQQQQQEQQRRRRRRRAMRRPPKCLTTAAAAATATTSGGSGNSSNSNKPDPERWLPMSMRSYIKDLPARRKKELRRLRALEQEQKRKAAERRKAEAAAAAVVAAAA